MEGEFGGSTAHGSWLVFLALVALWIALAIEARSRRLSSLLEAALKESEQLRAAGAEPGTGPVGEKRCPELEQLAAAVEGEGKGAPVGEAETREAQPAGSGGSVTE